MLNDHACKGFYKTYDYLEIFFTINAYDLIEEIK